MKKFMLIPILFVNLSYGMDNGLLFEKFKTKCKKMSVFNGVDVRAENIDANPAEVCAAIQSLSDLAKHLPREIYEKPLKQLVEKQRIEQPEEYQKVVSQLAHIAMYRYKGDQALIRSLIFEAVRIRTHYHETRGAGLAREEKSSNNTRNVGIVFALGCALGFLGRSVFG
jgi:hypothetical protein